MTTKQGRKKKTAAAPGPRPAEPTREEIARRAYEIWQARGGEPGHDQEDWLRAESELRERPGEA